VFWEMAQVLEERNRTTGAQDAMAIYMHYVVSQHPTRH
jgi:hypothetical protein